MSNRVVKEGDGWRVGFDGSAPCYVGLVAGSDWAMELTAAEFQDLVRLVTQLQETMQAIATELMPEEKINCETDSDLLWLEADGFPHRYSLRLILNQGRRCEGCWPEAVVPFVLAAFNSLSVF